MVKIMADESVNRLVKSCVEPVENLLCGISKHQPSKTWPFHLCYSHAATVSLINRGRSLESPNRRKGFTSLSQRIQHELLSACAAV
jgi:hypothetical protein